MTEKKIGFVGTDGRTLLAAVETSRSRSELYPGAYRGVVVKGTGAMEPFARKMGWPVDFIPVPDNSTPSYAAALIEAFEEKTLDVALVMPEGCPHPRTILERAAPSLGPRSRRAHGWRSPRRPSRRPRPR